MIHQRHFLQQKMIGSVLLQMLLMVDNYLNEIKLKSIKLVSDSFLMTRVKDSLLRYILQMWSDNARAWEGDLNAYQTNLHSV